MSLENNEYPQTSAVPAILSVIYSWHPLIISNEKGDSFQKMETVFIFNQDC